MKRLLRRRRAQGARLRDNIKIMIGGGQIYDEVRRFTGADAFGKDAMEAVALARGRLS